MTDHVTAARNRTTSLLYRKLIQVACTWAEAIPKAIEMAHAFRLGSPIDGIRIRGKPYVFVNDVMLESGPGVVTALFDKEQRTILYRRQAPLCISKFLLQHCSLRLASTTFVARNMNTLSQLTEEKFRINGRSLFQAYVEEVEDEDVFADGVLVITSESMMKTSSCVPDLSITDKHESAVSKLHEALDNLMAAAAVYSSPRKRKRSQSPLECSLRELSPAVKKSCCQLSDTELLQAEYYVNPSFAQGHESAQKSKTKLAERGNDRSDNREYLRMVECAKEYLIEFPVDVAMNVLQSNAQLLLVGEERQM